MKEKRFTKSWLICGGVALLLLSGCLQKPKPNPANLRITVIDQATGEGILGTMVTVGERQLVTDQSGRIDVEKMEPGAYTLHFERPWYQSAKLAVNFSGRPTEVRMPLTGVPLAGAILYSCNVKGGHDVFSLNLENRSITRVTDFPGDEEQAVQRSSTQIVFVSDIISANKKDLYLYDVITKRAEAVCSSPANDDHPSVDQSGQIMVFHSMRSGRGMVYWKRLNNTAPPTLLGEGHEPEISPDGKRVAYINDKKLWVCEITQTASGNNPKIVATPNDPGNPRWSPDGKYIAFDAKSDTEADRFIFVTTTDSNPKVVQATVRFGLTAANHQHPCWSQVGDRRLLLFNATNPHVNRKEIFCVELKKQFDQLLSDNDWIMVSGQTGSKDDPH